jgi:hypothetical protein
MLYRLQDRSILPYFFTIEDFQKRYGYLPKYDPNKPVKRWFDDTLASTHNPYEIHTYPAALRELSGEYKYYPAGITVTAEIAWTINLPDNSQKPSINLPFDEWPIPIKFDPSNESIVMKLGVPFIQSGETPEPAPETLNDHEMILALYNKLVKGQ